MACCIVAFLPRGKFCMWQFEWNFIQVASAPPSTISPSKVPAYDQTFLQRVNAALLEFECNRLSWRQGETLLIVLGVAYNAQTDRISLQLRRCVWTCLWLLSWIGYGGGFGWISNLLRLRGLFAGIIITFNAYFPFYTEDRSASFSVSSLKCVALCLRRISFIQVGMFWWRHLNKWRNVKEEDYKKKNFHQTLSQIYWEDSEPQGIVRVPPIKIMF